MTLPVFQKNKQPVGSSDPEPEPRQHYEVHCGKCHWWGMVSQMRTIYKSNPSKPGDVIPEQGCPICLSDLWLEYRDYSIGRLERVLFASYLAEIELKVAIDNIGLAIKQQVKDS